MLGFKGKCFEHVRVNGINYATILHQIFEAVLFLLLPLLGKLPTEVIKSELTQAAMQAGLLGLEGLQLLLLLIQLLQAN